MSRIGRAPITVPAGVEVKVDEHNHITVKGPKGTLERDLVPQMKINVEAGVITVTRPDDTKENVLSTASPVPWLTTWSLA